MQLFTVYTKDKTMQLSMSDLKELLTSTGNLGLHDVKGSAVVIRTVTHYYVGKVLSASDGRVLLGDACWVADTGRWSEFLSSGSVNEAEPYPDQCSVALAAIVDWAPWNHDLIRLQK